MWPFTLNLSNQIKFNQLKILKNTIQTQFECKWSLFFFLTFSLPFERGQLHKDWPLRNRHLFILTQNQNVWAISPLKGYKHTDDIM